MARTWLRHAWASRVTPRRLGLRLSAYGCKVLLAPSPGGERAQTLRGKGLAWSPGRSLNPEQLLLKDLFALLSDQPIRSLLPGLKGCRCYRRGAVWGYLEVPFSGAGDVGYPDSAAMRWAVARQVGPTAREGLQVVLVERCQASSLTSLIDLGP